ncbi:UDP-N-acetylmuramoylalanine--D-glutamate ligase [Lachnospiraceae bacterium KM106-2]|nr:UDP-N-acetylmuramoylalanine--D-glutamate ligase [Lachnospiraceae bacterium KM106-2]
MELKDKQVLVVGSGLSGVAATKLLKKVGAFVTIYDSNANVEKDDVLKKFDEKVEFDTIFGEISKEQMANMDLVVLSPGVPTDLPFVNEFRTMNTPIWGEIELAYNFAKGKVVAITGTNGKTTTTALTGSIMEAHFASSFVVGNIGTPYTDMALQTKEDSVTVAEISSFQLETIHEFHPKVSAILNITPDHLNRHHTMENYINTKISITRNQTEEDACILNYEDEELRKAAKNIPAKVIFFSSKSELEEGLFLRKDEIIAKFDGKEEVICNIHELKLLGAHNYENIMAAVGMAMKMDVPMDIIKKTIKEFKAVEHRIEYVDTINDVKYYNDSKGTNPDAAIKAVQAMITPTIVIGGGYDKESSYEEWIASFGDKVRYLVLLGQTKDKIAKTAKKMGFSNIVMVETLKEAVEESTKLANKGDSILLSPACASWGMFKNFEERGDMFKQYVNELK